MSTGPRLSATELVAGVIGRDRVVTRQDDYASMGKKFRASVA